MGIWASLSSQRLYPTNVRMIASGSTVDKAYVPYAARLPRMPHLPGLVAAPFLLPGPVAPDSPAEPTIP